jgi:hypothetical protein
VKPAWAGQRLAGKRQRFGHAVIRGTRKAAMRRSFLDECGRNPRRRCGAATASLWI